MNSNLHWEELSEDQICVEINKRFPEIEYEEEGTMYIFFGKEWGLLNPDYRDRAEERFRNGILGQTIKGIRFELTGKPGDRKRERILDKHGDTLYTRIRNDIYRK